MHFSIGPSNFIFWDHTKNETMSRELNAMKGEFSDSQGDILRESSETGLGH